MKQIIDYFQAERFESLVFIGIGVLSILLCIYFIFYLKQDFHKGFSVPVLIIALIQIFVGSTIFFRSPKDITRVQQYVDSQPDSIKTIEIPRMQKVMKSFQVYLYIELFLFLAGGIMILVSNPNSLQRGAGVGLGLDAIIMLIADYFAMSRGATYLEFLLSLTK
ncbi:MAG: hypothetical protein SFU98_05665 [Leptospiraceae bacterium]|nr:hypothetical protein [Leptospiraceae bacterium]